jgi:nitroimidazol reductase NimA-like FMN-containing flavoprotein (pyridoxamine 5'-phosphate oxidase superfamily)
MPDRIGYRMVQDDVLALVREQGHGVLSLASGNRAYGVPISYGYDADGERFVLEFVSTADSKKRAFVADSTEVTLTIQDVQGPDTWRSAIATGTLHPLTEDDVSDRLAALFFSQATDIAKEARWTELEGFQRDWYELRVTELSGRQATKEPVSR